MEQELGVSATEIGGDAAKETIAFMTKREPLLWSNGTKVTLNHMKKALREAKKRLDAPAPVEAPTAEPPRECTARAIEANGGKLPDKPFDTCAVESVVRGKGLVEAAPRLPAEFFIEAHDATGCRRAEGGDAFFVAIRGASRVRARIYDGHDGSYRVEWKPPQSGFYEVAVSFFGVPLPGSPFKMHTTEPKPFAPNCLVKGDALLAAVARHQHAFQVHFKDRLGNVSRTRRSASTNATPCTPLSLRAQRTRAPHP